MKQLQNLRPSHLVVAAALACAGMAYGQQTPDPYQGVSQPPPDDTITASPEAQPPAVKPSPATTLATPSAVATPAPAAIAASPATASTPATYNPDEDIVSSIPGRPTDMAVDDHALETRNPADAGIVTAIPSPGNQLSEGTNVRVRLSEQLSTRVTEAGTPFRGEVTTAVFKDGRIIIPPGSILKGRVVSVRHGHHFTNAATLRLRPDLILLPDGTAYHLYANVIGSQAPGTRTDSEGGIQPASHWKKDSAEYGVGMGAGAITGAHFGGPGGALLGAGIGATLVTAHLLLQHPSDAVLPPGSVITFSLSEPMELTPTRN